MLMETVQTTPHRTHTHALFLAAHARCAHTFGPRLDDLFVCLKSHFITGHVFVECSFDPASSYFLITCCLILITYCLPDATDWNQKTPCATPPWGGMSGHLADPTPDTSYEPKFCIDVSSEHTPINLPDSNRNFPHENDATIVATTEDLDLSRHSKTSSSSQHTAASRVPTLLKLVSLGTSLTKVSADYDSVASLTGIKETCADVDRETVVSNLFGSQNVVQTLKDRQNLHNIFERKAELAVRGEKLAQQRFFEAEADVEVKHWEKRNSDMALYKVNQEFGSQRFQLQQANRWADQAQKQARTENWK